MKIGDTVTYTLPSQREHPGDIRVHPAIVTKCDDPGDTEAVDLTVFLHGGSLIHAAGVPVKGKHDMGRTTKTGDKDNPTLVDIGDQHYYETGEAPAVVSHDDEELGGGEGE